MKPVYANIPNKISEKGFNESFNRTIDSSNRDPLASNQKEFRRKLKQSEVNEDEILEAITPRTFSIKFPQDLDKRE